MSYTTKSLAKIMRSTQPKYSYETSLLVDGNFKVHYHKYLVKFFANCITETNDIINRSHIKAVSRNDVVNYFCNILRSNSSILAINHHARNRLCSPAIWAGVGILECDNRISNSWKLLSKERDFMNGILHDAKLLVDSNGIDVTNEIASLKKDVSEQESLLDSINRLNKSSDDVIGRMLLLFSDEE